MFSGRNFSAVVLVFILACTAEAGGWTSQRPPVLASLSSPNRNNVFYVGEQPTFTVTPEAVRYEVRDYYGNMVDQAAISGPGSTITFTVNATAPGWYKLYLYGNQDQGSPWGFAVAGTNFGIFRNNSNFPALPAKGTPGGGRNSEDEVMRGVAAIGPQRLYVDNASDPAGAIAAIEQELAIDKVMYTPFDPVRTRPLMINFPNGTQDINGVTQIVQHFKNDVRYWEGRNEPNGVYSGSGFALSEEKQFYQAVKSVDPTLQVLGPAVVSVDPGMAWWIADFLQAGGGQYVDAFSFHAYNCVNGDLWLTRTALTSLKSQLAAANLPNLPIWQTEQGYMAAVYGSYQPRLQGRWTMLQMMAYEQFGIPKEHNHLWYDTSHGFWDFPVWWENDDGSLNPAASLMRVWSEELFGLQFAHSLDFGTVDNDLYIGDVFTNGTRTMMSFMTAGNPYGSVTLSVGSGDHLHVVSPFGVESDLAVVAGKAILPVSELPVYVELAQGQTCDVAPRTYGQNLSLANGVTVAVSGSTTSPLNPSVQNDPSKIVNGILENWYWRQTPADADWMSNVTEWPATVEIDLPQPALVSDVIIQAGVPWQLDGTLLDYDLQYWDGTQWSVIEHVSEPTKTWQVYSPDLWCSVDSYFSDRCVFEHHFPAVSTDRIRLVVNDVTYGGGATVDVANAGGQTGLHQITLREVSIFAAPVVAPIIVVQPASQVIAFGDSTTLSIVADALPNADYVWQKDGVIVQDSASPILPLVLASDATQGIYAVTVTDAGGTVVSAPATVLLATPINSWLIQYFPGIQPGQINALLASDTTGDGIPNLSKYFFNIVPTSAATTQNLPHIGLENIGGAPYVTLSYSRNPAATDVSVAAQCSSNLQPDSWVAVQPDIVETNTSSTPDPTINTSLKFLITTADPKFFRLQLSLAQGSSSQVRPSVSSRSAPRNAERLLTAPVGR